MAGVNLYQTNYSNNQCSMEPVEVKPAEQEAPQYDECLPEPSVAEAAACISGELEADPVKPMPDVEDALSRRLGSELRMCTGLVATPAWTRKDARAVAEAIVAGKNNEVERFIKYANQKADRQFVRNVINELSSSADGIDTAGYIMAGITDMSLNSRILYSIAEKEPVTAARILGSYEYFAQLSGIDPGDINEALNKEFPRACFSQPADNACYGPRIFQTYAGVTATAAADIHISGSDEHREFRDLLLHLFGEYDRDPTDIKRQELETELPIISSGVFTSWQISYRDDGRVNDIDYKIIAREMIAKQDPLKIKLTRELKNGIKTFFDNEIEKQHFAAFGSLTTVANRLCYIFSEKLLETDTDTLKKLKTLDISYYDRLLGEVRFNFSYDGMLYVFKTAVGGCEVERKTMPSGLIDPWWAD